MTTTMTTWNGEHVHYTIVVIQAYLTWYTTYSGKSSSYIRKAVNVHVVEDVSMNPIRKWGVCMNASS